MKSFELTQEMASLVKGVFETSGIPIAEWARSRGFSSALVYQILDGKSKCVRGQSHHIAVALGLKLGQKMTTEEVSAQLIKLAEIKKIE